MRAWVFWLVVLFACSKKSEPPKAGSGSPAAVSTDASVVAAPVAADAAAEDAGVAPDPKLSGIPAAGILVATVANDKLVVAKLDRTGVAVQHQLPLSETGAFGWLDAKTLVVLEPHGKNDKPAVMKIVDGKPTETVELEETWQQSDMLVTKSGEVWVERCTEEPEGPEPCTKLAYQRVWPSKASATKRPKDVDAERVGGGAWARGAQGPAATVKGPANVKLKIEKITPKMVSGHAAVGVVCTSPGAESQYPSVKSDEAQFGYVAKSARWVLADPPIYEVTAQQTNPVGQVEKQVDYFRACSATPLGGFISLGGPLWGQYTESENIAGTWEFRVGTTSIGSLDGGALRANRW